MLINTDSIVSITEANQNFSKVAKLVDKTGSAVILKNNVPKYIVLEYKLLFPMKNFLLFPKNLLKITGKPMRF